VAAGGPSPPSAVEADSGSDGLCEVLSPKLFFKSRLDAQDYDATLAPGQFSGTGPTEVEVQFNMTKVVQVNVVEGSAIAIGYLNAWWQDPRLAFNASSCFAERIELVNDQVYRIWRPDLHIQNLFRREGDNLFGKALVAKVYPDGSVSYKVFRNLNVHIDFTLDNAPFDEHIAKINISSLTEDESQVLLKPRTGEGLISNGLQDAVFRIPPDHDGQPFQTEGEQSSERGHSCVSLSWTMGRKPEYYRWWLAASFLYLLVVYSQFFMPADSAPARAYIPSVTFLTVFWQHYNLYDDFPKGAQTMLLSTYTWRILVLCVVSAVHMATVQAYLRLEALRRHRRDGILEAKGSISKLAQLSEERQITMRELLQFFMPNNVALDEPEEIEMSFSVEDQLAGRAGGGFELDDALAPASLEVGPIHSRQREVQRRDSGLSLLSGNSGMMAAASALQRREAIQEAGLKERDLIILKVALKYFEESDTDKSGDLALPELRCVFRHFDWYLSVPQLASAACAYARDQGADTPDNEEDFTMKFATFAPFLVEAEAYVKLYQLAVPPKGMWERYRSTPLSKYYDVVAQRLYWPLVAIVGFPLARDIWRLFYVPI